MIPFIWIHYFQIKVCQDATFEISMNRYRFGMLEISMILDLEYVYDRFWLKNLLGLQRPLT